MNKLLISALAVLLMGGCVNTQEEEEKSLYEAVPTITVTDTEVSSGGSTIK